MNKILSSQAVLVGDRLTIFVTFKNDWTY